ncbi:MAG TPA: hypothetical protein DHW01_04190, partial [Rhodobacter sp.]|nr:hypothetical protein [Rhodobacter sp.]
PHFGKMITASSLQAWYAFGVTLGRHRAFVGALPDHFAKMGPNWRLGCKKPTSVTSKHTQ